MPNSRTRVIVRDITGNEPRLTTFNRSDSYILYHNSHYLSILMEGREWQVGITLTALIGPDSPVGEPLRFIAVSSSLSED